MPRLKSPCALPGCDEQWSTLRCGRCRMARYCSPAHQKQHWSIHAVECIDAGGQGDMTAAPSTGKSVAIWSQQVDDDGKPIYDWRGEAKCRAEQDALGLDGAGIVHPLLLEASIPDARRRTKAAAEELGRVQQNIRAMEGAARLGALGLRPVPDAPCDNTLAELRLQLLQAQATHARAVEAEQQLVADITAARRWAAYESGHETRDVLENGIRRIDMEGRYGRAVTLKDVQDSMAIPRPLRSRLIGCVGRERYDPKIPWHEQPFLEKDLQALGGGGALAIELRPSR